jgi:CRP-like cAMP-binding protein
MGLEDDIAKLAQIPTFAPLDQDAVRLLAFSAEPKVLRAGDVLFRRGEPSNGGFVVLTGSIALDASDTGTGTARIVRAPSLIGEAALLTQTTRPATAIAREPASLLRISRQLFHRVLGEYPRSAEVLQRSLGERLRQFTSELEAVRKGALAEPETDSIQSSRVTITGT